MTVLAAVVLSALVFGVQWQRRTSPSGDMYWYLRSAELLRGRSPAQAEDTAGRLFCELRTDAWRHGAPRSPCTVYHPRDVPARYVAIFSTRPGYPLVVAVCSAVTGLRTGYVVATGAAFVAMSTLTGAIGRLAGLRRGTAVAAAGLAGALPCGFWASRPLAEGTALATSLVAVLGVVLVQRGRRSGYPVAAAGIAATYATKSAQGVVLTLAVVVTGALLVTVELLGYRPGRLRTAWRRGGVALLGVGSGAAWLVVSHVLALPTLTDSVQDMATAHYSKPDIPDPMGYLRQTARVMWHDQIHHVGGLPWPFWPALLAAAALLLRTRTLGLAVTAVSAGAIGIASAHPFYWEYDRLISGIWLVVALGTAAAAEVVVTRWRAVRWWRRASRPPPASARVPG